MSTFTITFNCDNDSFADGNLHAEISRTLRATVNIIDTGITFSGVVRDSNGNRIGAWSISKGE